jgi:hypothetical protein
MSYEHCTAALGHSSHKIADNVVAVVFIDAQSVFDCDWDVDCVIHGADTVSHKLGLAHQAGTKGTILNPIGGTAAVEVNLVIAIFRAHLGRDSKIARRATP